MNDYIIRIKANHDCWVCEDFEGDPGRTLVQENATRFFKNLAILKCNALKMEYPNRGFEIEQVGDIDVKLMMGDEVVSHDWVIIPKND